MRIGEQGPSRHRNPRKTQQLPNVSLFVGIGADNIHIGVTPTSGALTPAYSPLRNPSLAMLLRTTSSALKYTPRSVVCNRTFTRSNGCPTTTAHTPPNAPAAKLRRPTSEIFPASFGSSFNSSLDSGTWGSLSAIAGGRESIFRLICAPGEEEEEDIAEREELRTVFCTQEGCDDFIVAWINELSGRRVTEAQAARLQLSRPAVKGKRNFVLLEPKKKFFNPYSS